MELVNVNCAIFIIITADFVHTNSDACTCRGFTVEVTADDGKMYSLTINDLLNAIIPDQSSVKVKMHQ